MTLAPDLHHLGWLLSKGRSPVPPRDSGSVNLEQKPRNLHGTETTTGDSSAANNGLILESACRTTPKPLDYYENIMFWTSESLRFGRHLPLITCWFYQENLQPLEKLLTPLLPPYLQFFFPLHFFFFLSTFVRLLALLLYSYLFKKLFLLYFSCFSYEGR